MLKKIKLSKNLFIGKSISPLLLPDIGTFFNQDISLAKKMIYQLKKNGAKIIKGEVLHNKNIVLNSSFNEKYLSRNKKLKIENFEKLIHRKVLPLNKYFEIFDYCKKIKLPFCLSVYDFEGANFAKQIGAVALKIASSNLNHRPLIEHVVKLKLPVILDTGKSSYSEIRRAVQWCKDLKFKKLHLQHSPYAPPKSLRHHDLMMIKGMIEDFNCTVGLSDHFNGAEMMYASIPLGATTLEKGIIPDHLNSDQDVYHSLKVSEFKKVNDNCKKIYLSLGRKKRILNSNGDKHPHRMCLVASKTIKKNEIFDGDNIGFAMPQIGISVEKYYKILGKKNKIHLNFRDPISIKNIK